jgi:hypothetical protein
MEPLGPDRVEARDVEVSLVRQGSWTEKELEELAAAIERARKEKSHDVLDLDYRLAPEPVLVIDKIERPTENQVP